MDNCMKDLEILWDEKTIEKNIKLIAKEIDTKWQNEPIVNLIPVLTGGIVFGTKLMIELESLNPQKWLVNPIIASAYEYSYNPDKPEVIHVSDYETKFTKGSPSKLIEDQLDMGAEIIYICDSHKPDDIEFEMFPVNCVAGTSEAEIIPELIEYPGYFIPKQRYSGFFNTDREKKLEQIKPENIIICGVCTDICVLHTAADARNRDYNVSIPVDCVASFDYDAHNWAINHMRSILGVKLI